MANPKNPGYSLHLEPTGDPDVIRVHETDDVDGDAPVRAVSAVEAGRLVAAVPAPAPKKVAPSNLPAGGATTAKKAPAKKAAKRG